MTRSPALAAAETAGASDSLKRMLAHQTAGVHGIVMKLLREGTDMIQQGKARADFEGITLHNVEGSRLLGTAARLEPVAVVRHGG